MVEARGGNFETVPVGTNAEGSKLEALVAEGADA
jgi:hypothetical protein